MSGSTSAVSPELVEESPRTGCTNARELHAFDGKNDYIETPDITTDFDLRNEDSYPWTIIFWAKSSVSNQSDPDYPHVITQSEASRDATIMLHANQVSYHIYGGTPIGGHHMIVTFSSPPDYQEWHNYIFTKDTDKLSKLYIDGDFKASGIHGSTVSNNINTLRIGGIQTNKERFWNGIIDDVRIYNRVLIEEEIQQLAAIGGTVTEAELMDINGDGLPDRH